MNAKFQSQRAKLVTTKDLSSSSSSPFSPSSSSFSSANQYITGPLLLYASSQVYKRVCTFVRRFINPFVRQASSKF